MNRIYNKIFTDHFKENRQMIFVSGPRQVGKTTIAKLLADQYVSWDDQSDRMQILQGPKKLAEELNLSDLVVDKPVIAFDEIHKYSKWKNFIKGFFDLYSSNANCYVTGSGRLNIFKRGGDSLMGRYFLYRMHPLSVREFLNPNPDYKEIQDPHEISHSSFEQLITFGGFPEPFLKAEERFYNRWRRLRTEQFFHEDIRDMTKVQDVAQLEILAEILIQQSGQLTNYSNLANAVNVSVDTIKRWTTILENLFFSFSIKPWFTNIKKSLIKQPKIYLWDWTLCKDEGSKNENFIASHLLKAVHFWTDIGLGEYGLFYLRDKMKREADFLVTKDRKPWFIVEVKTSKENISPNLDYFQKQTLAKNAFQVTFNMDYVARDCFEINKPVIVPAKTFLSQLI